MPFRLAAMAALLALAVAASAADARPRAAKRLKAFSSCAALVGSAARHVPPPPVRRDIPPPMPLLEGNALMPATGEAPEDTSQTNVQEAGVDEPDTVKTDGRTIFALANSALHAVDARS